MVVKENIGDWSEMRICKDGTVVLTKTNNDGIPVEMDMMCPNDSLGTIVSKIMFDENTFPIELITNYYRCIFDWINDNMVNITIAYSDSLSVKYDSIQIGNNENAVFARARVPNIDEKPWTTRLGGVLELAGGFAGIGVGGVMVLGSGAAEVFSAGSSTPISLPSIAVGAYIIRGGTESVYRGFINAFTNSYETGWDPILGTLSSQAATQTFERGVVPLIPDQYFYYLADNKYNTTGAGWASFFTTLLGQAVSNIRRPFTWFDLVRAVQQNVFTGIVKDVTATSAITRGYIGPYILESPSGRFDTEYGIVVFSTTDGRNRQIKKEINGNGGMIEYSFNNLKPSTTYKYCTYYMDKTNGVSCLGEYKTFTTESAPFEISKVDITKATYYPNNYTYNNKQYSFKYNCTTYVTLKDNTDVVDWGYVYIDPEGNVSNPISLKQYSGTVGDPRYAYCRNEANGKIRLQGYVKYKDDDEIYYGEVQEFPIEYPAESSVEMKSCTFQGTESNAAYQGKTYKYKSTYRYLFTASGAYWLKVGTEETGSGWNNWNNLPDYMTSPVDGTNALTVNYYYDDKTFTGDYNVYLKATDATHSVTHLTTEYVTYTHSGNQFTGCTYHSESSNARSSSNYVENYVNEDEYNIILNKPNY